MAARDGMVDCTALSFSTVCIFAAMIACKTRPCFSSSPRRSDFPGITSGFCFEKSAMHLYTSASKFFITAFRFFFPIRSQVVFVPTF